jgi:hypothetical protein
MGSCRKGLYKCRKACCRPKASQMMALLPSSAPALKSVEAAPPSAVQNLPSSSRHELPTRLEAPAGSCRRTAVQRPPASPQARCPRDRRRCCMPNSRPSERTPKGRPKNSAKSQTGEPSPTAGGRLRRSQRRAEPEPGHSTPCRCRTCRAEPSRTTWLAPTGSGRPPRGRTPGHPSHSAEPRRREPAHGCAPARD